MALRPAPDNSPYAELKSNAADVASAWTAGCYFFVGGLNSIIWGLKWYNAISTGLPFDAKFCLWGPNNDVALATKVVSITATGEYTVEWDAVDKVVVTGALLAAQNSQSFPTAWTQMYGVSVYAAGRVTNRWVGRSALDPYFDHSYNSTQDCYYSIGDTKPKTFDNGWRFFIGPIIYGGESASDTFPPSFDPTPIDEATGIAIDSDLVVDITDNDSGVLASTVTISVTTPDAITTIWTAGSATGGWSGSVSAIGDGYQYTLTPPSPFDYLEDISWGVYAEDEAGNSSSDSWSFTTAPSAELIPPVIGHIFNLTSIQTVGTVSVVGGTSIGAGIDLTSDIEGRAIPSINVVHYWNQFDDHAAILSLQRKKGEKNWELGRRTRDAATNLANSSYHGLVNGITQGLGLSLFKSMCITPKVGYNGDYLAADPYILFSGPYLYLYSDYANDELEYQIDRYEPGGNYEYLRPLIDFVNTSTYFTARLWPGIDEFTRSMTVLNQSNRESMTYELVPKSTRFRLRKARIVRGSVFFSDRNLFRDEVLLEELVDTRGKYYINYSKGIVTVYTVPSGNITVRYQYNQEPFCAKASPVILHDINSLFREKLFQQVLLNDGTYTDGIPTELGVDIINEILSVVPMYWGV